MRTSKILAGASIVFIMILCTTGISAQKATGFILEHENQIVKTEPGTHNGKGITTGYSFFSNDTTNLVFRKRVLHSGSEIGYHLQEKDEIYYIISGEGEMKVNDSSFIVKAGDAILTHPGNYHGLQQKGKEDLVVIIDYVKK